MKGLIIGGDRHAEWIDVLDGSTGWLDIRTATNYRVRKVGWAIFHFETGEIVALFDVYLLVHETLATGDGQEQMIVQPMLQQIAMDEFARTHGTPKDLPTVPDTPAGLLGPDGRPA